MSAEFVRMWKKAQAFLNQYHKSGSNSFANQQADYMSLLALRIKSYTGKHGSFICGTNTNDVVLRLTYPTKSQPVLVNEAFEEIMYQDEISDRPVGYKLGRNIVLDILKEEMEKEKLKDQAQENKFFFKTLIGQFSQVVGAIHQDKSSPGLLNCTQELLGTAHQHVL
ncbi:Adenosylhomocysteinase [Bienertia sinuspersici]